MDESIFEFFALTARTGYFCHAAVGIPEFERLDLEKDLEPLIDEFHSLSGLAELKHGVFKRLEPKVRHRMTVRLRDALRDRGAFVAGFFTPVRAFVLEAVRTDLYFDGAEELPEDPSGLALKKAAELRDGLTGPGASAIVSQLLQVPVTGVVSLLGAFDCPFKIVYDPRGSKEDRAVADSVEEHVDVIKLYEEVVKVLKPGAQYFGGFQHDRVSEQEIGLQVADILAGEVKEFFLANPELLEFGASRTLVTPTSREAIIAVTSLEGRLMKAGALHRLPKSLVERFFKQDPDGRSKLHLFRELLASGMITCYSAWGQPRHIMVFDRWVMDQLE